jgi:hypothetical protein
MKFVKPRDLQGSRWGLTPSPFSTFSYNSVYFGVDDCLKLGSVQNG